MTSRPYDDHRTGTREVSDMYAGWTNRETWAVSLHLSNTEVLYLKTLDVVKDGVDGYHTWAMEWGESTGPTQRVADALQSFVYDLIEPVYHSPDDWTALEVRMMAAEIGSLWRVDWRELASAWMDPDKG